MEQSEKIWILFDLDGTLTDPKEGITKSVQYALKHCGIQVDDLDSLCPFIGPPLRDSYMKFYGFSSQQATEAIHVYREYFTDRGWRENVPYEGIKEMLETLKEAGFTLLVATSKPEVFAKQILDYFEMSQYFDFIGGADLEEIRDTKAAVIRYVMEHCGITEEDVASGHVWMVGDREHDVLGARQCGLPCAGVLYGFGSRKELEDSNAAMIASSVDELGRMLLEICENDNYKL